MATVPTILCGSLGFIAMFSLVSCSLSAIEYVGRNSLILMLVHPTFLLIGIYGVYPIFVHQLNLHGDCQFAIFSLALLLVVYMFSLLCIPVIHKYFPFVIG